MSTTLKMSKNDSKLCTIINFNIRHPSIKFDEIIKEKKILPSTNYNNQRLSLFIIIEIKRLTNCKMKS